MNDLLPALRLPSVGGLLFRRCPSAILGTVGAVVVDTLKAMEGRRLRSHVSQKGWKIIQPARVYRDASSPIILEGMTGGNIAARFEAGPSRIQRMPFAARCKAMRSGTLSGPGNTQTAAAFGVARKQVFSRHNMYLATKALTFPTSSARSIAGSGLQDGQSGERPAHKINRAHAMEYSHG